MFIQGEPERAPNIRETGSGVYIYYIFIYLLILFVRDLAWQPPNAHAQLLRVATYVTGKGRQRHHSGLAILNSELGSQMAESPLPTDLEYELHHHTED